MSQRPCGRGMPRWSVETRFPNASVHARGGIASTAELVGSSAMVSVGPPLFCRPLGAKPGGGAVVLIAGLGQEAASAVVRQVVSIGRWTPPLVVAVSARGLTSQKRILQYQCSGRVVDGTAAAPVGEGVPRQCAEAHSQRSVVVDAPAVALSGNGVAREGAVGHHQCA